MTEVPSPAPQPDTDLLSDYSIGDIVTGEITVTQVCSAASTIGNLGTLLKNRQKALETCYGMLRAAEKKHQKELDEYKKLADLYKTDRDAFEAENIELRKAACVEECTQMHFRLSEIRKTLEQLKQDNKRLEIENRTLKAKLKNSGGNYYETE